MITQEQVKHGTKVYFTRGNGTTQNGMVKSTASEGYAFVVYHCDGNWNRIDDYTLR